MNCDESNPFPSLRHFGAERELMNANVQKASFLDTAMEKRPLAQNTCPFCSQSFKRIESIIGHINAEHYTLLDDAQLRCPCGLRFLNKYMLKKHDTRCKKNNYKSSPKCELCSAVLVTDVKLREHLKLHRSSPELPPKRSAKKKPSMLSCPTCTNHFEDENTLKTHFDNYCSLSTLVCNFCHCVHASIGEYLDHARQAHYGNIGVIQMSCDQCDIQEYERDFFLKHDAKCQGHTKFKCDFCAMVFASVEGKSVHLKANHSELATRLWVSCPTCGEMFPSQDLLQNHIQSDPCCLRCEFCPMGFEFPKDYLQHGREAHEAETDFAWIQCCHGCGQCLPKNFIYNEHVGTCTSKFKKTADSKKPKITYTCNYCSEQFQYHGRYYTHCRSLHRKKVFEDWEACGSCKLHFPGDISKHTRFCRDFKCYFCSKVCYKLVDFLAHSFQDHRKEVMRTWGKCSGCSNYFPNDHILRKHLEECAPTKVATEEEELYKCPFCTYSSKWCKTLTTHLNKEHLDQVKELNFCCPRCGQYFSDGVVLHKHSRRCKKSPGNLRKSYHCEYCGAYSVVSSHAFFRHLNVEHLEKIIHLDISCKCGLYFPDESVLENHLGKCKQARPEAYSCSHCPFTDKLRANLISHLNAEHLAEMKELNLLSHCGKYFPDPAYLEKHHKYCATCRQKRLACDFCPYATASPTLIVTHINAEHLEEASGKLERCSNFGCEYLVPDGAQYKGHRCKFTMPELKIKLEFDEDCEEADNLGLFTCSRCDFQFTSSMALATHTTQLCSADFKCGFCSEGFFSTLNEYVKHATIEHMEKVVQLWKGCKVCHAVYPISQYLELHSQQCSLIKGMCQYCPALLRNHETLSHAHKKHVREIMRDWLPCPNCGVVFPILQTLKNHYLKQCFNHATAE